jgi:cytochrome c oxidase subunit II
VTAPDPRPRTERRAASFGERREERRRTRSADQSERRQARARLGAFALVAAGVLAGGVYLAAGDLFGQRGAPSTEGAVPVRLSMAGFTPAEIRLPAGEPVALELWTTDTAPHLEGGVHTLISDELDIYEELAAAGPTGESRRIVQLAARPAGSYDIYCDTCCGGWESPTMHGRLVFEA